LHYLVIIAPIALSVPIGWTNRFHHGNRWVLTRQAAEAIKREIFQFRTGATPYRDEATREKDLAKAIEDVTRHLARSEANTTALPTYSGPIPPQYAAGEGDDGMSPLTPDRYIEVRLDDQLKFFRKKSSSEASAMLRRTTSIELRLVAVPQSAQPCRDLGGRPKPLPKEHLCLPCSRCS
jgi:hypothetical protein